MLCIPDICIYAFQNIAVNDPPKQIGVILVKLAKNIISLATASLKQIIRYYVFINI